MKPAPQQVEEDVLIGPSQPPPSKLEMASRPNGLLEDLVVLGHVPITEVVIGNCQGHSSLDAPSELNLPQRIPSPLSIALLVPQAEG